MPSDPSIRAQLPDRVGIIGLGVMGGSLARSLAALPNPPEILGYSPDRDEVALALESGAIHGAAASAESLAGQAPLLVYATPLDATLALITAHAPLWPTGAVITDVCSLKHPLAKLAADLAAPEGFVGSHPMAGSEQSGFAASRSDLFHGAPVWLCPGDAAPEALDRVQSLWRAVGGQPRTIDSAAHDARMLRVSHLPQVVANALADVLAQHGVRPADLGPGGRDMTRLALSSPEMWLPLLRAAGPELAPLVDDLSARLSRLARDLAVGDEDSIQALMRESARWRQEE